MRTLARTTLACSLLLACNGDGNMATTQSTKTVDPTADSSSDPTADPTATEGATATDGATATTAATEPDGTTEPVDPSTTAGPTTAGPDTDPTTTAAPETTTGATTGEDAGLMSQYGAPCEADADCVAPLGATGKCLKDILGVYTLPGGYCSTVCSLPDQQQTYIPMANDCLLGADCIGLMGFFEGCTLPCTSDDQCQREGYECRQMPEISNANDPTYCLMTEEWKN